MNGRGERTGSWPVVALGEVAERCLGKMLDAQKNKGRLLPYLRNPNVRWFDVDLSDVQTMPFEEHEDDRYGLESGDVLICEGGEAGRAAIWNGQARGMKFQKAIHRVRCGPRLNNRFLVHRLMADYFSGRLADYYTGATIKHLTGQDLARYRFALPPLHEQRQIAEILDKADALLAKRRAALAQLDTLTQSIFLDMFGDPATNPKGWPIVSLERNCVLAGEYGANVASTIFDPTLPRYVRITDVTDEGELNDEPVSPAGSQRDWEQYVLAAGDVLFARSGATVGKTYMHRESNGHCVFAGYMIRFRPNRNGLLPEYLFAFTRSSAYRTWVQVRQRVVAQPNINARQYGQELLIPLPPVRLQEAFAARIGNVERVKALLRTSRVQLDGLFSALQHHAFRGDFRRAGGGDPEA